MWGGEAGRGELGEGRGGSGEGLQYDKIQFLAICTGEVGPNRAGRVRLSGHVTAHLIDRLQ